MYLFILQRLDLLGSYITPLFPEERHKISQDDAWHYINECCEIMRDIVELPSDDSPSRGTEQRRSRRR